MAGFFKITYLLVSIVVIPGPGAPGCVLFGEMLAHSGDRMGALSDRWLSDPDLDLDSEFRAYTDEPSVVSQLRARHVGSGRL
jgi:hypothetical protein